ncbi:MAG: DMT family transporter [Candidatus Zhuqueibacterota bacterium]
MNTYIGETAALFTAFLWTFTSILFTIAGQHVGSLIVNRTRLLFATSYLIILHFFLYGALLPVAAEPYRWVWLGLSGIIGLVLGDGLLFQAFILIGARLSMLIMAIVPIISTLLAWEFFNEVLSLSEIVAILLTLGGIVWVILERNNNTQPTQSRKYVLGILCGIGGAVGQAIALITAKKGLSGDFPALSANLIRVFTAASILWVAALFKGQISSNFKFMKNPPARSALIAGSVFGPFLGIWLSLIAIKHADIGIASTLMALPPIFLLPLSRWIFKEEISWRAIFGTTLAIVGVAIIFLVP